MRSELPDRRTDRREPRWPQHVLCWVALVLLSQVAGWVTCRALGEPVSTGLGMPVVVHLAWLGVAGALGAFITRRWWGRGEREASWHAAIRVRVAYAAGLGMLLTLFLGGAAMHRLGMEVAREETTLLSEVSEVRRAVFVLRESAEINEWRMARRAESGAVRRLKAGIEELARVEAALQSTVGDGSAARLWGAEIERLTPAVHGVHEAASMMLVWASAPTFGPEWAGAMAAAERLDRACGEVILECSNLMRHAAATAEREIARLERTGLLLLGLMLVVLVLEVLLVFEPAVRRMRLNFREIEKREAEQRYLAMVAERIENAVLICDARGCIEWVNEAFVRQFGYRGDEVLGKTPSSVLRGPETDLAEDGRVLASMSRGEAHEAEILRYAKDGTPMWVHSRTQPIRDASGAVTQFVVIQHSIAARKSLEAELLRTSERLEHATRCANVGVWEFGIDDKSVRWEPSMYALLRRDPATFDLTHEAWRALVHPEDLERAERVLYEAITRGTEYEQQFRMLRADGSVIHVLSRARALEIAGGGRRVVGANIDITEKVRALETLARSEELLTRTGDLARIGGWELDVRSMSLTWSPQVRRLHEVDETFEPDLSAAIGFVSPESTRAVQTAWRDAISLGESFDLEARVITARGALRWVRMIGVPEMADGACVRVRGACQDISELKEADALRQHLQNLLQCAIDAMPQLIFWKDLAGNYLGCNRAFLNSAGLATVDEVLGKRDEDFPWARQAEKYRRDDAEVVSTGSSILARDEFYDLGNGRPGWFRTTKVPLRDHAGAIAGVLGIFEDVTAEHEARGVLRRAKDAAEAADRAKTSFLANMSHEIRTPMTAILGFADLLLEPSRHEAERQDWIHTIKRNGMHLLAIVNDVLDLSKIEAEQMRVESVPCAPDEILQEVVASLRVSAEAKGLEFHLLIERPLPRVVQSDPTRLRQIYLNLVGNAVKFTSEGSVRVQMLMKEETEGKSLVLTVGDSGAGMSEEQLSRVFRPFAQADATTSRKYGGTGLGLAITSRLVHLLGGTIQVDSVAGEGTTFTVALPLSEKDLASVVPVPAATESVRSLGIARTEPKIAGARILLAEDGPDNSRLICFHLHRAGASVEVAVHGRQAIEMAERAARSGSPYDLILMDMHMPEMDGYEATRALRLAGFKVPIIAVTAHAFSGERERCLEAGCDDYHMKPISASRLIQTCHRWLTPPGSSRAA